MREDFGRGYGDRRMYDRGYEDRAVNGIGRPRHYDRMMRNPRDYGYDDRNYDMTYGRDGSRFNGHMNARYDMGMGDYGDYGRDYNDYAAGKLSNEELRRWQNKLCESMDKEEVEMFAFDSVIHQAEQMTINFDKYTKEEFYTTVLMLFTDYYKTIGPNIPMYLALAKDFLEDKDAKVKYGEKLAAYCDCIANV